MSYFRFMLLLLVLVLFGFASIGYSQDNTEKSNAGWAALLSEPLSVMVACAIAGIVVILLLFVFQMVKWWRPMWQRTQAFPAEMDRVKQELMARLDSIQEVSMDSANKLKKMEPEQTSIQNEQKNIQNNIEKIKEYINDITLEDLKPNTEIDEGDKHTDYPRKAESEGQSAQDRVSELFEAYKAGEPIDFINIKDPTPSQKALIILNRIARAIEDWTNELGQSGTANPDLIQTLGFANQDIKDKLKEVREPAPPLPESLNPDTDVSTDAAYNAFKDECRVYVARYEGMLVGHQLERKIAETEYNQFIPKFIKDRLVNGVARFINFEQLPEQVDEFLQIVDYEVVPIEIGETKADARLHEIQASRQTGVDPGTIVEVVLPGLRRKADGEIVQKPVVIRGE